MNSILHKIYHVCLRLIYISGKHQIMFQFPFNFVVLARLGFHFLFKFYSKSDFLLAKTRPSVCLTSIWISKNWYFCHISWLDEKMIFNIARNWIEVEDQELHKIATNIIFSNILFSCCYELMLSIYSSINFVRESPEIVFMPAATFYLLCDLGELFLLPQNIHMAEHAMLKSSPSLSSLGVPSK